MMQAIIRRARAATRARLRGERPDDGAALALALVLVLVGGVIVGALLTYAAGVLRAAPVIERRSARVEAVKSAVRMAITQQRATGPVDCFAAGSSYTFNGIAVSVSCTSLQAYTSGSGRYGVISTASSAGTTNVEGLGAGWAKEIDGSVFLNAGGVTGATGDVLLANGELTMSTYESALTPAVRYDLGAAAPPVVDTTTTTVAGSTTTAATSPSTTGATSSTTGPPSTTSTTTSTTTAPTTTVAPTTTTRGRRGHLMQTATTPAPTSSTSVPAPALPPGIVACGDEVLAAEQFARGSTLDGAPADHAAVCVAEPWWSFAGDRSGGGARSYPSLPQLPTYERPGSQAKIGSCNLYYPGRYLGSTPLELNGGTHYFASGIYYFERPLRISGGAVVVMGEGRTAGCSVDADAAFVPTAPRSHEITGKGATLLLGGGGTLSVTGDGTQLRMNRRVSSSTTRGSEGLAIRSVSFGVSTADVEIPADTVTRADGSSVAAASHSVTVSSSATPATYRATTAAPTDAIVTVQVGNGSAFDVDGYVFTPQARLDVSGSAASYRVRLNGGVVASRVRLALERAPDNPAANWFLGVQSEPIQRQVRLDAVANVDGRRISSTATMEVNIDRSYAINSWTVDA